MDRSEEQQFIRQTYKQPYPRNVGGDAGGYQYDDFVWKLARRFTNSNEEAAAAADEMFDDIRRCAEGGEPPAEARLTARIALRRLLKFLR